MNSLNLITQAISSASTRFQDEPEELSLYEIVVRPDLQCGLGDKVLLWQHHAAHMLPLFSLSNVIKNNAALEEIALKLKKLSNEEAKHIQEREEHEVDKTDQSNTGSQ